tara:strand:+ start:183 stop:725 length:543 start_codon:yes stop_codon:yes gene_type:complete
MSKTFPLLLAVFLSGCATTVTMPVSYQSQSFTNVSNVQAELGKFTYLPYLRAEAKSNQITNTALFGTIVIPDDVSTYVRRATGIEFRKGGARLENSNFVIRGEVIIFEADDLGYSVDWNYSIKYTITNKLTGNEVFAKIYNAEPRNTGKFALPADFIPIINLIILDCIEKFMADTQQFNF